MKKSLALVLTLCMVVLMLAVTGCTTTATEEGAVKMGLGVVTSIAKSRDMAGEVLARAQVDTTVAAVSFDKDGKIVGVRIDVAQVRVDFDADMKVSSNKSAVIRTKKEQGTAYNMLPRSGIKKEWYEQIAALENWMIGKTIAEVKVLKVTDNVPNDAELTSSVTIVVENYLAAVEAAWDNAIEVSGIATLGLGVNISIAKSRDASETAQAQAQADVTVAATGFDQSGKVVATVIDTAQTRVLYNAEGEVATDKAGAFQTKKERGDDYGMKARSDIGKEWYEQIEAFEEWMIGKTMSEIKGLKVKVVDAAHQNVPDVPELTSSVTITVEGYIEAVFKSFKNKK